MTGKDTDDGRQDAPPDPPGSKGVERPPPAPITPSDEPSALERGARILERLRKRPPDGGTPGAG